MNLVVIIVVLLSAVMHATWHALIKAGTDRFLTYTVINIIAMIFGFILLYFAAPPANYVWNWVFYSTMLHLIYKVFLIKAYGYGDLSKVFPLARGIAPILVTIGSIALIGETIETVQIVLILGIVAGISIIIFEKCAGKFDRNAVIFAILSGVITASYTIVDGMGSRIGGSPFWFVAWIYILDGTVFPLVAIIWRRQELINFIKVSWKQSFCAGLFSITSYGAIIWALHNSTMASVSVLRETSIIFAAIIGTIFFKESFGNRRILAASIVAFSIILSTVLK